MTFDSMTRPEFAELFVRTTLHVKSKGCTSPEEYDDRINQARINAKNRAREADIEGNAGLAKALRYRAKQLAKLLKSDFSETAFRHRHLYPKDIVNLTFLFGRKKAQEIKLAASRARLRSGKSGAISRYSELHKK